MRLCNTAAPFIYSTKYVLSYATAFSDRRGLLIGIYSVGHCKPCAIDHVVAYIMAMFYGRRTLYNLDELFEDQDLELLFGRSHLKPKDFNDGCLGRTLDRIAGSGFHTIFGTVARTAIS